jgi:UDP-galactopyranose mutase
MKWQYRIVHKRENNEETYAIHEYVGKKYGITEEPVYPVASSPELLLNEYTAMVKEAFHLPILEWDDF